MFSVTAEPTCNMSGSIALVNERVSGSCVVVTAPDLLSAAVRVPAVICATAADSPASAAGRASGVGVMLSVLIASGPPKISDIPSARALSPPSARGTLFAILGSHLCTVVVSAPRSLSVGIRSDATCSSAAMPAAVPASIASGVTSPGGSSGSDARNSSKDMSVA